MKTVNKTEEQREVRSANREPRAYITPEVNIFESKDAYVVEAEMPGVNKQGLEVTLEGSELTITGHRNDENCRGEPIFREIRPCGYRRVFELDPMIDTQKISARMEQGILTLTLPKQEKVKPRRITIE